LQLILLRLPQVAEKLYTLIGLTISLGFGNSSTAWRIEKGARIFWTRQKKS